MKRSQGSTNIVRASSDMSEALVLDQQLELHQERVNSESEARPRKGATLNDAREYVEEMSRRLSGNTTNSRNTMINADHDFVSACRQPNDLKNDEHPSVNERGEGGPKIKEGKDGIEQRLISSIDSGVRVELDDIFNEISPH